MTAKDVVLYHNPRCSKSRETLRLLQERGIEPRVIEYLKTPPSAATLGKIIDQLGIAPHELLRKKEPAFSELGLDERLDDRNAVIQAMVSEPVLMERPIVVTSAGARIGRPPEAVLALFD
jgi:arsenate reductase